MKHKVRTDVRSGAIVLLLGVLSLRQAAAEKNDDAMRNTERFYTIISRDAAPELVLDGAVSKPGLTFTEGPSWLGGKLYFSNYYLFWKYRLDY